MHECPQPLKQKYLKRKCQKLSFIILMKASHLTILHHLLQNKTVLGDHISRSEDTEITFRFFTRAKNQHLKHAVFEVTPKTRRLLLENGKINIGWSRCNISDFVSVTRCFKCLGFGHTAKYCNSESHNCSHCAGNHNYRECHIESTHKKCVNCIAYNNRTRDSTYHLNVNHSAMDNSCPCYVRSRNNIVSKIDYGN